MKVRMKFCKHGAIRFIGHLDVMRYFQKALRRAHIDVAYTTGYSPHQIMTFAAPLGVGLTSDGEYMDIECNSITTSEDMLQRINAVSVPGIQIYSVRELPAGSENAMASVKAAAYLIRFREGKEPNFDYLESISDFIGQEQILITKETKKGESEIDIKPGIYDMHAQDGAIYLMVDASSAGNIKPLHVIQAYASFMGCELEEQPISVHRIDTYTMVTDENGTESLLSMGEIGSIITKPRTDEDRIRIEVEANRKKKEAMEEATRLREELLAAKKAEIEEWNRRQHADHNEL